MADTARCVLADLAIQRGVAAATQNQAFNAILFLLREVLGQDVRGLDAVRAKRGPRLPVVLSDVEVKQVLGGITGTVGLMLRLIFGGGLRVTECTRMRVQDLDFSQGLLYVRGGKGDKDRTTLFPKCLFEPLREHLARVKALHEKELAEGGGDVELPYALARKYPKAEREWAWQYVFPAKDKSVDPRSGAVRRHHVYEQVLQRAMREAVVRAGIAKPAHVHTLNAELRSGKHGRDARVTGRPARSAGPYGRGPGSARNAGLRNCGTPKSGQRCTSPDLKERAAYGRAVGREQIRVR